MRVGEATVFPATDGIGADGVVHPIGTVLIQLLHICLLIAMRILTGRVVTTNTIVMKAQITPSGLLNRSYSGTAFCKVHHRINLGSRRS